MLRQIESREKLEELLSGDSIIFKHSNACPISAKAYEEAESFADNEDVYYLVVQTQRELSNLVEEETGVRHESPQAFVIRNGEVEWHASHRDITREALEEHS